MTPVPIPGPRGVRGGMGEGVPKNSVAPWALDQANRERLSKASSDWSRGHDFGDRNIDHGRPDDFHGRAQNPYCTSESARSARTVDGDVEGSGCVGEPTAWVEKAANHDAQQKRETHGETKPELWGRTCFMAMDGVEVERSFMKTSFTPSGGDAEIVNHCEVVLARRHEKKMNGGLKTSHPQ